MNRLATLSGSTVAAQKIAAGWGNTCDVAAPGGGDDVMEEHAECLAARRAGYGLR